MTKFNLLLATLLISSASFGADKYVELCTGDRYLSKNYGDGNVAGHALIYVNGLCKDMGVDFPQVKICDSSDNHKGVGISLDAAFRNVKWVAVPTRELTLFGDYGKNKVDDEVIQNIFKKAKEYRVFENVKLDVAQYPKEILDYTSDKEDQTTLWNIGTGIAFNTARNLNCVKTKIGAKQLDNLAQFLNGVNEEYYSGEKTYEWSLSDNCTHLTTNAFASTGIVKYRKPKTKRNIIANLFTLTLPKSEFLKLVRRVNKTTYSPRIIWENEKYRNFFNEYERLPWTYGNLVKKYSKIMDNDFFKTKKGTLISLPTIGMSLKKVERKKYANERYNLELHKKKITKALKSPHFKWKFKSEPERKKFLVKYKNFLKASLAEINAKLK
jgi:hypothetical protein